MLVNSDCGHRTTEDFQKDFGYCKRCAKLYSSERLNGYERRIESLKELIAMEEKNQRIMDNYDTSEADEVE